MIAVSWGLVALWATVGLVVVVGAIGWWERRNRGRMPPTARF
jgi:hypothetical protein